MSDRFDFQTPVGRFVSGDLVEKNARDHNNDPIEPDKQRWEFGVAFQKADPAVQALVGQIMGYAQSNPAVADRVAQWGQTMAGFSMKIGDGDKPSARTGMVNTNTAGCYVFYFSTSIPLKTCRAPDNVQIDPSTLKRGWYVDLTGSCAHNGKLDHTAGIYMNPEWIRLVGEGEEIIGGRSAEQAFGAAPAPALPQGARAIGSTPPSPGAIPGAVPQAAPVAPAVPQAAPAAPAVPNAPVGAPVAMPGVPVSGTPMPGVPAAAPVQAPTASPSNPPAPAYPPYPGAVQ